jgi:large subunit ribosomal protein L21
MYAVLETGGFQFVIKEGERVKVPRLQAQPKEKVSFDKILFIGGENPFLGAPYVKNAKVEAEILSSGKSDKVTVFKKKKRVKYRRTKGHRQEYSEITIHRILPPE